VVGGGVGGSVNDHARERWWHLAAISNGSHQARSPSAARPRDQRRHCSVGLPPPNG
jgi:hypothetical protein